MLTSDETFKQTKIGADSRVDVSDDAQTLKRVPDLHIQRKYSLRTWDCSVGMCTYRWTLERPMRNREKSKQSQKFRDRWLSGKCVGGLGVTPHPTTPSSFFPSE